MKDLCRIRERLPWAKSFVILVHDYGKYRYPAKLQGKYAKAFFLDPGSNNKSLLDIEGFQQWFLKRGIRLAGEKEVGSIGPLRFLAAKAGLGIIRKNNFFYTKNGSYNQLLGYLMDQECERTGKPDLSPCSEKCSLCQRACKTKALAAPFTMNPLACVSFWTTFGNTDRASGLSEDLFEEWVCGCDNCQDACPYNRRHDWERGEIFPGLEQAADMVLPENFENLPDEFLAEQVISRTSNHLKRSDAAALRRNAARSVEYKRNKQKDSLKDAN